MFKSDKIPALKMGSRLLNKKVFATDNRLEKENLFFPVECH